MKSDRRDLSDMSEDELRREVLDLRRECASFRRLAEEKYLSKDQLEQRLHALEAAILALPAGFQLFDGEDRLVIKNNRMIAFDDTGERDKPGTHYTEFVRFAVEVGLFPEAAGREEAFIVERLAEHRAARGRTIHRHIDGRAIQVEKRLLDDGSVVGLFVDVSELMKIQEKLVEAEADYRRLFERSAEGIYRSSPDGHMLKANPALVRFNGYENHDEFLAAVKDIAEEWYVDPSRRAEFIYLLEKNGAVENFESEIYRHKTRERIWISENAYLVKDDNGEPLFYEGTVRDITWRRKAEAATLEALKKEQEAGLAKTRFLANMRHELHTPLNAIIGFSDLLRTEAADSLAHAVTKDYANDIHGSGQQLLSLITDILDVVKLDADQVELTEIDMDVIATVKSSVAGHRQAALDKGISVEFSADADLPTLYGDEARVKQIVDCLLSNALKFSNQGDLVNLEIRIDSGNGLVITVEDSGIGIDPNDIENALMIFGQVDTSYDRAQKGTGLGLSLVQLIVKAHEGVFQLDSSPGVGTKAHVTFPEHRLR